MSNAAGTRPEMWLRFTRLVTVSLVLLAFYPQASTAQWAAGPGETVRNVFGPQKNQSAPACRGACGLDCPSSCDQELRFECAGGGRLLRVQSLSCGTHPACREHDDCLDRCSQEQAEGFDCSTKCNTDVMSLWPVEQAASWAAGGGPFQGDPVLFEYSMDRPGGPEAFYRCPPGAVQQCGDAEAVCLLDGAAVDPVFASYAGSGAGSLRVAGFRSGSVCTEGGEPDAVCQDVVDIRVTGSDQCAQPDGPRACTWYGFEFDYRNAIPGEPLYCQSSGADGDFLGGIVEGALKSVSADPESELGSFLGGLQKELNSGKSLDQVFSGITMVTEDGQVLGGPAPPAAFPSPGLPGEVAVNSASGHLLVPMFELYGAKRPGTSVDHHIRCSQGGKPVIETVFRLHYTRS